MRPRIRQVIGLGVVAGWLLAAGVVVGHGGTPVLELDPEKVVGGGVVEVAGENFEDFDTVELFLVGAGSRVGLRTVEVRSDGHFTAEALIPAGTTPGPYVVEAGGPAGPLASGPLIVIAPPSPSLDPSSSAARSASPDASTSPAASPPPLSPEPSAEADLGTEPTGETDSAMMAAVVAIAVVAGVAGGIVLARRGRPTP